MLIAKYVLLLYNIREKICLQGVSAPFWQKSPMFKTINQGREVSVMSERTVSENNKLWETAEKIAQQVVAEKKAESEAERQKQKKRVVKLVLLMMLIALIIVFASIAWFAMNKAVSADTMAVTAEGSPFELEVRGPKIENESDFSKADETYTEGEVQDDDDDIRQTTGAESRIMWRKAANADGTYEDGLEPNSHGTLTFWVVPKRSGPLNIEFNFDIRAFHATYNEPVGDDEPTLKELFEITDELTATAENEIDEDDLDNIKNARKYMHGHVLFFAQYNSSTGYYSDFLGSDKKISFGDCINPATGNKYSNNGGAVDVVAGQKYQVTIYWKWANTFEQMVFDANSPFKDSPLFAADDSTDRTAIFTYLKNTTNNYVFYNLNGITTKISDVENNTSDFNTSLTELTNAYNNADQLIGNNVDYALIEMTAGTV